MAVVQYSAVVTQIRGKLGGSVFNKSKNAYTLQTKQKQPKGSRGYQSEVRNFFSKFQRSWKALTNAQRTNWQTAANNNPGRDRFGNLTTLSGYNQFVKASMLAEYASTSAPASPYTGAAPSALMTFDSTDGISFYQVSSGDVGVTGVVNVDVAPFGSPFYIIIDVSQPVSAGVMSYHGRWSHVFGNITTSFDDYSFDQSLGNKYPMPLAGQKVFFRIRIVHVPSGPVVQSLIIQSDFTI